MARPTKMTQDTINKLEHAFAMGCSDLEACIYAGICKQTLYNYQEKNPKFLDRKELLKENPALKARETIYSNITADIDTAKWYLERKKKGEFSLRSESRDVDKDGNDVGKIVYIEKEEKDAIQSHIESIVNDGD